MGNETKMMLLHPKIQGLLRRVYEIKTLLLVMGDEMMTALLIQMMQLLQKQTLLLAMGGMLKTALLLLMMQLLQVQKLP